MQHQWRRATTTFPSDAPSRLVKLQTAPERFLVFPFPVDLTRRDFPGSLMVRTVVGVLVAEIAADL